MIQNCVFSSEACIYTYYYFAGSRLISSRIVGWGGGGGTEGAFTDEGNTQRDLWPGKGGTHTGRGGGVQVEEQE